MKKLFLLLALLGMVAVGCSKDEGGSEDNIPENIFFGLDKDSVTISPDGGSVDVIVYSNYKWEISGTSDWCTPSAKSGDANEDGQKVTFSADVAYDDREATFWFRCADEKIKFVVSQKLKVVIIPDANNTFNIPAEGGVAVISYQTSVDCEVIIPEKAQDWITIAPALRGLVSESITLDIAENTTYSARTAVVKVVAKDNAELAIEYTINQEQKDGVLVDGNNTFNVSGAGGSVVIEYQANVDCDVIIPDDAQDWVTIAPATRGLSTYSTTLNIAENNSGKGRRCVVKVVSKDNNKLSAEYTIIQNPRCFLYYTSNDGKIVQPNNSSAFGATIISNTYIDGVGVIEFNAPITTIGEEAFAWCRSLTSVTIPDSVTTIGDRTFYGCSSLTSVTIPDSVTSIGGRTFYGCSSLTSITIPYSVTTIGSYAFSDCSSLTSVTIGDSVTTIGECTFCNCLSLTRITIPDSVTTIGYAAFSMCYSLTSVTIGDSVTTIGDLAFYWCYSLTSVIIPDSVTTVGSSAFSWCSNLQEFNGKFASEDGRCLIVDGVLNSFAIGCGATEYAIPDGVTTIGEGAFYVCSSLTSVTIPDSVTTIGDDAFRGCDSLTSVAIGDSVTTIGGYAFRGCDSLTSVAIGDSVTTIGEGAFCDCSSLTSVTIGESVTTIGYAAFNNCSSLTSVTIGDSVTTIGDWAFEYCESLTSVTIGDSVTTIGDWAFYNCSNLTSVTIPDSVTTIGYAAFVYCENLNTVYCKAINPPTTIVDNNGYWYGFAKVDESGNICNIDCTIYVPTESVEAYKSAQGWKEYANSIEGYNF